MFLYNNCYTYMAEYSRIIVIEKRLHHRHGPRGVQCVCMFSQLIMNTAGSQNCNPVICMLMYTCSSAMVVYTCSDVCKKTLEELQLHKTVVSWRTCNCIYITAACVKAWAVCVRAMTHLLCKLYVITSMLSMKEYPQSGEGQSVGLCLQSQHIFRTVAL